MRRLLALMLLCSASGCAMHPRAQNPFPGVFRVAVVPFGNKTGGAEGLDTLKITELFASELQRIPSYEVVPIVEVTQVLGPIRIDTNQPELAYAVARAVHAQAVIVGDVIEYDCYYPPRLGLHCEMYAMVTGEPEAVVLNGEEPSLSGVPDSVPRYLRPFAAPFYPKRADGKHGKHGKDGKCSKCGKKNCLAHNGDNTAENIAENQPADSVDEIAIAADGTIIQTAATEPAKPGTNLADNGVKNASMLDVEQMRAEGVSESEIRRRVAAEIALRSGQVPDYRFSVVRRENARPIIEPWVVRHSRIFQGENLGLARKLKDYYFFKWDERGGDWFGYTERTEDFNRFCCNQMIYEMLVAAGGKWETLKGFYLPQPWQPWPWR